MDKIIYKYPNYIYHIWIGDCKEPEGVSVYCDMTSIKLISYLEKTMYLLLSDENKNKHRIIPTRGEDEIRVKIGHLDLNLLV